MKNKILLIAVTLLLCSQTAFAQTPWTGAGTAQDPFQIYTVEDLEKITEHQLDDEYRFDTVIALSNRHISYRYCHFALMNDIETPLTEKLCNTFQGYIHGKGHILTLDIYNGVYTQNTLIDILYGNVDSLVLVGNALNFYTLFYQITTTGKISHITCNLDIIPGAHSIVASRCYIFCYHNDGIIEYCVNNSGLTTNSNQITYLGVFSFANNGIIDNCINTANIISNVTALAYVHLFSEKNYGTITNCVNHGDIIINGIHWSSVSCFAYNNSNLIFNCINTGDIHLKRGSHIGFITSLNGGTVSNCLNTGNIMGGANYTGGIVAKNGNKIENCLNTGYIAGDSLAGGIFAEIERYRSVNFRNNLDISKTSKHALLGKR